ncbi:MAG: diacylglycerol kinase family protein [Pseudomonadota bacterium]
MNDNQKNAVLILNPESGRGKGRILKPSIRTHFQRAGLDLEIVESRQPGDIKRLVAECYRQACPRVIVAGGDGTIFEAVNGILQSENPIPLGIVPIGTGNDFVKAVGIPEQWAYACDRIIHGTPQLVDLGRCNGHYFANGVGIGLDAQIATIAKRINLITGKGIYQLATLIQLFKGIDAPRVSIEVDGTTYIQEISLVAVANGTCFGGSFKIAPKSSVDDGEFDVVIADPVTRRRALSVLPKIRHGRHLGLPEVQYYNAKHVVISSEQPLPIHLDGELVDQDVNRYEIEIMPKRLNVIV